MKGKHFEISVKLGHHAFTFCCTTMSEAYDAIMDIATSSVTDNIDLDEVMEMLIKMKNGWMLAHIDHYWSIHVRNGEV